MTNATTAERQCTKCERHRPISEFGSRSRFNQCPACRDTAAARRLADTRRRRAQAVELEVASGIKTCIQCRFALPRDRFHKDRKRPDGRFPYCKSCRSERTGQLDPDRKRYQSEDDFLVVVEANDNARRKSRDYYLRRNYGITTDYYEWLLAQQGGVCAICEKSPEEANHSTSSKFLDVDHDHSCCPAAASGCGRCVRGLLCGKCNNALGHFDDDLDLIQAAMDYLNAI